MNTQDTQLHFYQQIGQLFYAIAASDKVVRKKEYQALRDIVKQEWRDMDDFVDEFGADAAFQIEIVFDWFDYEQMDADQCFLTFEQYFKDNKSLFSQQRRELIWKTSNAIANAFSGKNKSELIMLTKLHLLFKG